MTDPQLFHVPPHLAGARLDQALAQLLPEYSRARLQQWIRAGAVLLEGRAAAPRTRVAAGASIEVSPVAAAADTTVAAQDIALAIVHADPQLLVVDKPPGLVVHPAAGNRDGTLQNALLHYDPALAGVPRAGIVHRLDKDTSGLLVVARTLPAHTALVRALAAREVRREYLALVHGEVVAGGSIEAPIGRHPVARTRMAVVARGRPAHTEYRIAARFDGFTLLRVRLHSGRTHQIRVHLQHRNMPLVGDRSYGTRARYPAGAAEEVRAALDAFRRQALHATHLALSHPASGERLAWDSPLPPDLQALLDVLQQAARA